MRLLRCQTGTGTVAIWSRGSAETSTGGVERDARSDERMFVGVARIVEKGKLVDVGDRGSSRGDPRGFRLTRFLT